MTSSALAAPPRLHFDNRFRRELPGDPETAIVPRQVVGALWSPVLPTPVAAPTLVAWSPECAALLDLDAQAVQHPAFVAAMAGNELLAGMQPWAANYGGHQFGQWAGQLGDGRAISLGEAINARGERWELQLKGAGPTPYSRRADGRAVLRSSIREFLCSEAMHHLGVPTTRALTLVATGEPVWRDMFYDGNAREEPGAIVCRVAPSFLRFGNFELLAARDDVARLGQLVDFTIARDFPALADALARAAGGSGGAPDMAALEAVRAAWFREICVRTAQLVVHWMRVGFVHGVLNTDNMSVLGLTIDYGPYGWLEEFDPTWTPNTTDAVGRRYRYGQQPAVVQWNLVQLAEALVPLFTSAAPLEAALDQFLEAANSGLEAMNRDKFGFATMGEAERTLVREAYALLHRTHLDYTNAFRAITQVAARIDGRGDVMGVPSPAVSSGAAAADAGAVTADLAAALVATLAPCSYDAAAFDAAREAWHGWSTRYLGQLAADGELASTRAARLRAANPVVVLRNYLAQEAIEAAEQGDVSLVHALLDVLRDPYTERPGLERFTGNRPEWARTKAGCSMLSCSS